MFTFQMPTHTAEAPPYLYAGILSTNNALQQRSIADMKFDNERLHGLERLSRTCPMIKMWCDVVEDLISACIRILFASFERDKFRCASIDGRKHLTTMLWVLPDSVIAENLRQRCRDLSRQCRRLVASRIARARACIHSGVLEHRDIKHTKVSKAQYVAAFRTGRQKISWRFNARRHKLSARWSDIMDKRTWISLTPESFRGVLAAWHWGREWWRLSVNDRPPFGSAKMSELAPEMQVLKRGDDDPTLCLYTCAWGFVSLELRRIDVGACAFFEVGHAVKWAHIIDPRDYTVLGHKSSAPLEQQMLCPGELTNEVRIQFTNCSTPLLKYAFGQKVELGYNQLHQLVALLGLQAGGRISRSDLLTMIATKICNDCHDSLEVTEAYIQALLEIDTKSSKTSAKVTGQKLKRDSSLCVPVLLIISSSLSVVIH